MLSVLAGLRRAAGLSLCLLRRSSTARVPTIGDMPAPSLLLPTRPPCTQAPHGARDGLLRLPVGSLDAHLVLGARPGGAPSAALRRPAVFPSESGGGAISSLAPEPKRPFSADARAADGRTRRDRRPAAGTGDRGGRRHSRMGIGDWSIDAKENSSAMHASQNTGYSIDQLTYSPVRGCRGQRAAGCGASGCGDHRRRLLQGTLYVQGEHGLIGIGLF